MGNQSLVVRARSQMIESSKSSPYILSEAVNDIEDLCDLLLQRAIHVSYSKSMIEDVRLSAYPSSYDCQAILE